MKRYHVSGYEYEIDEEPDGEFVKFEDHLAEIGKLQNALVDLARAATDEIALLGSFFKATQSRIDLYGYSDLFEIKKKIDAFYAARAKKGGTT